MRVVFLFILLLTVSYLGAQTTYIPLNSRAYLSLDRCDLKSENGVFTASKPVSRRYFAAQAKVENWNHLTADDWEKQYLTNDLIDYLDTVPVGKKPLFKHFFQYNDDLIYVNQSDFVLHVNPVVVLEYGKDLKSDVDEVLFENYRGVEISGMLDKKIAFYTLLTENQARYASYVQRVTDTTLAVPYEGFWKQYGDTGVDFLRAQTYIDINATKHLTAQLGYGKNFIGDGRRSLILSDFGNNYPYIKLTTRIWKIEYSNIFAQLVANTNGGSYGLNGYGSFPKKQFANHHLSVKFNKHFTFGLFESVLYGDSTDAVSVGMYNPLIFYKAMEQQDGSAGNTILGLDFKTNWWDCVSIYGQLVIDELVVSEVFGGNGWWGNKQGFQLGAKYFDAFGIKTLNAQLELNRVRPYLYAHESNFTSYSHYNMPLAHPLGANFREIIASLNYRPLPKLYLQADLLVAKYGNDIGDYSYGRDILESYIPENRPPNHDYGNDMFQGVRTDLFMFQGKASYMLMQNMTIDADLILRKEQSDLVDRNAQVFNLGFRWNFPSRSYLF